MHVPLCELPIVIKQFCKSNTNFVSQPVAQDSNRFEAARPGDLSGCQMKQGTHKVYLTAWDKLPCMPAFHDESDKLGLFITIKELASPGKHTGLKILDRQ